MSGASVADFLVDIGGAIASQWLAVAVICALLYGVFRSFFRPRRIQAARFDWRILRHEVLFSALTLSASGLTIGVLHRWLRGSGALTYHPEPGAWWVTALEFAFYFFVFDLYFYLLHRLMHVDPIYRWVHATHHRSTAPNPLTAFSFNPLEGALAGGFMPLFLSAFELHRSSLWLIYGFQPLMSMFVHSGHEVFPKWWYSSSLTKWLLTPMFHDQHHQYFHCNYGGFTTIWDRLFGTVNPGFERDFAAQKERLEASRAEALVAAGPVASLPPVA